MLAPATMRLCNNAALAFFFPGSARPSCAIAACQQNPASPGPTPSLTVDRDPVRSPDIEPPVLITNGNVRKQGEGYVLHTDVEEVVLNCTVLDGNRLVPDLKKENFEITETALNRPHQLPAHGPAGFHRHRGG